MTKLEPTGYDPTTGDSYWLTEDDEHVAFTAQEVQRRGLTEQLRQAIVDLERQTDGSLGVTSPTEPQEGTPEATIGANPGQEPHRGIEVLGGNTAVWRWQRIVDGDDAYWAIDNRPAIDAHEKGSITACPEYQHIVIPEAVLHAIKV